MLFRRWYRLLKPNAKPSANRVRQARARPAVEALEDRSLLATLSVPTTFVGQPGDIVTVPVNLDVSDGLVSADVALGWDTTRLEIVNVQQGTIASGFALSLPFPDMQAGTAKISLVIGEAISGRGSGSLVRVNFRVKDNAPGGAAVVNLRQSVDDFFTRLNEGGLALSPVPSNTAGDALDGLLIVPGGPGPLPPAGVTITESGGSTVVAEGGATDFYVVVLNAPPAPGSTVTVQLQAPADQVVVSPAPLQFTASNWNIPQIVTVQAVDDLRSEGNHSVEIVHSVTSTDPAYNGLSVPAVRVNITDNGPNDFTTLVTATLGKLKLKGKVFQQTLTLTNNAANPSVTGPLIVVLNNLNPRARLKNAGGVTQSLTPAGRPFVVLIPGADNVLSPGESLTFTLKFAKVKKAFLQGFTLTVMAGEGRA